MTQTVKSKVKAFLTKYNIKNTDITVALSGGSDSVTLLFTLLDLKEEFGLNIYAAHLNHNIRGQEALRDENFVKSLCKEKNIKLFLECLDFKTLAKTEQKGLEETARKYRYDFLKRVSKGYIATAHNKNDNAETILLNIIRGSGVHGACGMDDKKDNIIRPLIEVSKDEIIAYISVNNLKFVTDSTNENTDYSRNRVRHEILPLMAEINNDVISSLIRFSKSARDYEDFVTSLAEDLIEKSRLDDGYNTDIILDAQKAVRYKVYSILVSQFAKQNVEKKHFDKFDDILKSGGKINLPNNFFVEVKNKKLKLYAEEKAVSDFEYEFDLKKTKYGNFSLNIKEINRASFEKEKKSNNLFNTLMLDYDKIPMKMILRSRKNGDKYKRCGTNITKSLKKLFNESKIPENTRNGVVVFEGDGEIVAVEGFGASQKYGVDDTTKRILSIKIIRGEK